MPHTFAEYFFRQFTERVMVRPVPLHPLNFFFSSRQITKMEWPLMSIYTSPLDCLFPRPSIKSLHCAYSPCFKGLTEPISRTTFVEWLQKQNASVVSVVLKKKRNSACSLSCSPTNIRVQDSVRSKRNTFSQRFCDVILSRLSSECLHDSVWFLPFSACWWHNQDSSFQKQQGLSSFQCLTYQEIHSTTVPTHT